MNDCRRLGILGGMFDPIHQGHLDTAAAAQEALDLTALLVIPSHRPPHRTQPIASRYHRFAMTAMAIAGRNGWRAIDVELERATRSYTTDTLKHFQASGFRNTELYFITGADAFLEIGTWKDYPALLDQAHFVVVSRPGVDLASLPERLPALSSRMRSIAAPAVAPWSSSSTDAAHRGRPGPRGSTSLDEHSDAAAHGRPGEHAPIGPHIEGQTFIFLIDAATADVSSTAIRQACRDRRPLAGMVPPSVEQHIVQHGLYGDSPLNAGIGLD